MKAWPVSKLQRAAWKRQRGPLRLRRRAKSRALSPANKGVTSTAPILQGSMNQHLRLEAVPFIDLGAQRRRLGKSVDEAISRVLAHCNFINGPEVTQLEAELAAFCGAKHVVSCASGTDALLMVL